jgi:hypothetical protein
MRRNTARPLVVEATLLASGPGGLLLLLITRLLAESCALAERSYGPAIRLALTPRSPGSREAADPYGIYLRGELARLRDPETASDFLSNARSGLPPGWTLGASGREISALLPTQGHVDEFVARLSRNDARQLTEICSRWRNNSVADKIAAAGDVRWSIQAVPAMELEVDQAEPALGSAFTAHDYRLVDIARDSFILSQPPYSEHQVSDRVEFPLTLAVPHPVRLRIFDGIHRAIQLVRNGETQIEVCAPQSRP